MDEHCKIHQRLHDHFFCRVIRGVKVRTTTAGGRGRFLSLLDIDRILSTAGFITPPEGAIEAVQEIFVDTEVARIV